MTEEITVSNDSPFFTVPAKIGVQIGKRKRYFDTEAEALEALEKFNNPTKPGNKGIMAARKAAKAVKEAILQGVKDAWPQAEDVSDQAYKIRCTTIAALCTEKPEVYFALTGLELPVVPAEPVSGEGESEGAEEIVAQEANESVNESLETPESSDPLDFLS